MTTAKSGYVTLVALIFTAMMLVTNIVITSKMQESNNRRQCGTLGALIDAYEETPPTTPAGRNLDEAYRSQYALYGCQPPAAPPVRPSTSTATPSR